MDKRNCIGVSFVVLLFIGVAFVPSINFNVAKASDAKELIEVTSQACGINGFGNTTVKPTKQQYAELEQLFNTIKTQLSVVETRDEAKEVLNEAIIELNNYGLLPEGITVDQAQKLVTGNFQNTNLEPSLNRLITKHQGEFDEYENYFCFVVANVSNVLYQNLAIRLTCAPICKVLIFLLALYQKLDQKIHDWLNKVEDWFHQHKFIEKLLEIIVKILILLVRTALTILQPILQPIFEKINTFLKQIIRKIESSATFIGLLLLLFLIGQAIYTTLTPIALSQIIGLGIHDRPMFGGHGSNTPASGWITTFGINKMKLWDGAFYGALPLYPNDVFFSYSDVGIVGYTGLKFITSWTNCRFLGSALAAKISPVLS